MNRFLLLLSAWASAGAIVAFTLGPVACRPQFGHPQLERFAAFLVLGACWGAAYHRRPLRVLAGLTLGAVGLELAQALAPGRDAGAPDALAKVCGAAVGVAAVVLIRAAARRRARTTSSAD
jgi:hypothetical protein